MYCRSTVHFHLSTGILASFGTDTLPVERETSTLERETVPTIVAVSLSIPVVQTPDNKQLELILTAHGSTFWSVISFLAVR